jgi:AraC-like DNA-binding protein
MELRSLQDLLHALHLISGMQVAVYDLRLRCIFGEGLSLEGLCAAIHTSPAGMALCFHSDMQAFARVRETRKPYEFTCPFGLWEGIVPILEGNELQGYLFAGTAVNTAGGSRAHVAEAAWPYVKDICTREELSSWVNAICAHNGAEFSAFLATMTLFAARIAEMSVLRDRTQGLGALIHEYLEEHFAEHITLASLSLRFHCSTVTLTESFRREYGVSIVQYLTCRRMEQAATLLKEREISIGSIAERCGYAGLEYFSKAFKKYYGFSPREWREEKR